jgi:hypothetical protein
MSLMPIWPLVLLLLCLGAGFVLVKAPKVAFVGLALLLLVALPVVYFVSMQARPQATAIVEAEESSRSTAAISRVRGPIIVELDSPAAAPATQPSGKPWVDDWEAFVNASELPRRWLVAGTTVPFATEPEARREACKQAAVVLFPYVQSEFNSRPRATVGNKLVATNKWLMGRLQAALTQDEFIADVYITRDDRSYAQLWSCQLLLDASPRTLARVVDDFHSAAQRQVETSAVTWGGLAALGVVIVLLYAFLNWVTKGYFVWRLRAAAVMIAIVALLVVMSIA